MDKKRANYKFLNKWLSECNKDKKEKECHSAVPADGKSKANTFERVMESFLEVPSRPKFKMQ